MALTFTNPVIAGFAPDPSVCRVGDDFYLVNSSFTMMPGLPIYHSRDLAHWTLIGHALSTPDSFSALGSDTNGGIYAPTLRHHDGTFHLIVKNISGGKNLLITARDPAGEWDLPRPIEPAWNGDIDPDLFFDTDGTAYLARRVGKSGPDAMKTGAAEQFAWKFDAKNARVVSDPFPIWNGTGQHVWPEGGHLYRRGDFYYYVLAEGGTGTDHRVTIARRAVGKGLDDPALAKQAAWTPCPHNPVIYNDAAMKPDITSTGHADLIDDAAGHSWCVFLGERPLPLPKLGRETFLAPVEWKDGWPVVNGGKPITIEMPLETPLPGDDRSPTTTKSVERDDFDNPKLGLEWNVFRVIDRALWSLGQRAGWLTLHGTASLLSSTDRVAWVGRRLRHKSAVVTTRVELERGRDAEAGLSLFARTQEQIELIVTSAATRRGVAVRSNSDKVLASSPIGDGVVELRISIGDGRVRFEFSTDNGTTWTNLREMPTADAIGSPGFAGVYVGMQVTGSGGMAHFDHLTIEP